MSPYPYSISGWLHDGLPTLVYLLVQIGATMLFFGKGLPSSASHV